MAAMGLERILRAPRSEAIHMASSKVFVAYDEDRARATRKLVAAAGLPNLRGKNVLIKPNFNTADPTPGSTHIDTLRTVIELVKSQGPSKISVGDRSGPATTMDVFREKGVFDLSSKLGFDCIIFDEMPKDRWAKIKPPKSHWFNGFWFARPVLEADAVITLCCLKTHQYGGWFTMSLKVTTGAVHGRNMPELHTSVVNQRKMIAEMNYAYKPALVIMDGVEAFYRGGPMSGPIWKAGLTFASTDRVALDAAGVAALKMHGTTDHLEKRLIFQQDQIKRAAELGLGAPSPKDIELIPVDGVSKNVTRDIAAILIRG